MRCCGGLGAWVRGRSLVVASGVAGVGAAGMGGVAHGQDKFFVGGAFANWATPGVWSLTSGGSGGAGVPLSGEDVFVGKRTLLIYNSSGLIGIPTLDRVILNPPSNAGSGATTLSLTGSTLRANQTLLAGDNADYFNDGGNHENLILFAIGFGQGNTSVATIRSGTITADQLIVVGQGGGYGRFDIEGGTVGVGIDMRVGVLTGSTFGEVRVSGGRLNVGETLELGVDGNGQLRQTGGTINVAGVYQIGDSNNDDTLTYAIHSGGETNAFGGIIVGSNSNTDAGGELYISGGIVNTDGFGLRANSNSSQTARLFLSSGELNVDNLATFGSVVRPTEALISGGIFRANVLTIDTAGLGLSDFDVTGGQVLVSTLINMGTMRQIGGVISAPTVDADVGSDTLTLNGTADFRAGVYTNGSGNSVFFGPFSGSGSGVMAGGFIPQLGLYTPGTFRNQSGGWFLAQGTPGATGRVFMDFENDGILEVRNNNVLRTFGSIQNNPGGIIRLEADIGASESLLWLDGSGDLVNEGRIFMEDGRVLLPNNNELVNDGSIIYRLGGTVSGRLVNHGTVAQNSGAGGDFVVQELVNGPGGELRVRVDGAQDALTSAYFTQTSTLDGRLRITVPPGTAVPDGTVLTMVRATGGLSGTFGTIITEGDVRFRVVYEADRVLAIAGCPTDLTGSSDPNSPTYGVPDGDSDGEDFFFYLDAFVAGNTTVCDYTGRSDPNDPSFGVPDGDCDGDDFFYFLDIFEQGCF